MIQDYDVCTTNSGGYVHGVNLCKEHNDILNGR